MSEDCLTGTTVRRNSDEPVNQIYQAMTEKPLKRDWMNLLKEDLEKG